MDKAALKFIFSNAIIAATARGIVLGYGESKVRDLCRCLAETFFLTTSDGDRIYTTFTQDNEINSVRGFEAGSYYEIFEQQVATIVNNSTPTLSTANKEIVTVCVHAVIFGYAINPNTNFKDLSELIG